MKQNFRRGLEREWLDLKFKLDRLNREVHLEEYLRLAERQIEVGRALRHGA
jgi:hypothetical protein